MKIPTPSFTSRAAIELCYENDVLKNTVAEGKEQPFIITDIKKAVDTFVHTASRNDYDDILAAKRMEDTLGLFERINSDVIQEDDNLLTIDHAKNKLHSYLLKATNGVEPTYSRIYGLSDDVKNFMKQLCHKQ